MSEPPVSGGTQHSNRPLAVAVIVAITIVIAVTVGAARPGGLGALLATTCSVGFAGVDANITYSGNGAEASCAQEVQAGNSAYRLDSQATGTLICRYHWDGLERTVRDQGALKAYGGAICAELDKQWLATGHSPLNQPTPS